MTIEDVPDGKPLTDTDPGGPLDSRKGFRALCWLLERSTTTVLTASEVEKQIGIPQEHLVQTFAHRSVQAFARHLKWQLENGVLQKIT